MRFIDQLVTAPGERILHRARLHWTIFVYPSAFLTLFILPLVRWFTCEAVVTTRRIILTGGWLTRYTYELPLNRFESIRLEQSLAARIFGFGSIVVVGVGGGWWRFRHVARPVLFQREATRAVYERC